MVLCLITIVSWCASPTIGAAKIIYVDDTAPGGNNGESWLDAFRALQDALGQATNGDEIRVAQGIYRPNLVADSTATGRHQTFELKDGVALIGGYAGLGSPTPDMRNINQYETLLSGDLNADDISKVPEQWQDHLFVEDASRQDNAYSVVTCLNTASNTVLDGFTITGGNANGEDVWPYHHTRGGGMFVYEGSVEIKHCTFKRNSATEGGGGLYIYMASPSVYSCTFEQNTSEENGAGLFNNAADTDIAYCTFTDNRADFQAEGGAIYNYDSNPEISFCRFLNNYGGHYGGAMETVSSDPVVTDCVFIANESRTDGGAVHNDSASFPLFKNCQFFNNSTMSRGGAMMNYYCTPTVINCLFAGNSSWSDDGGAVHNRNSEPTFINCVLTGNKANVKGGGMSAFDSDVIIINCTFANNAAVDGNSISTHYWGGPDYKSEVTIHNSILWDGDQCIYNDDGSHITATYSNISCAFPGFGNIHTQPRFVDAAGFDEVPGTEDDNLRLLNYSPCIDAAENAAIPVSIVTDADGVSRFQDNAAVVDTGNGTGPLADMGAYEYGGGLTPPPPGINRPPIANAGPDQTAFAWLNEQSTVILNGTESYDPDGNPIHYTWKWITDNQVFETDGVTPTITLPMGQHTVNLTVSDGALTSGVDQTVVNVVQPLSSQLWLYPYQVERGSCGSNYVMGVIRLYGIRESEVDLNTPMTIYPGNIQAYYQSSFESTDATVMTTLVGFFDKTQLTNTIPVNGIFELTSIGRLKSGQFFSGTDQVNVAYCP